MNSWQPAGAIRRLAPHDFHRAGRVRCREAIAFEGSLPPPPSRGSNPPAAGRGVRNSCLAEGTKMEIWIDMIKRWLVIFALVGLFAPINASAPGGSGQSQPELRVTIHEVCKASFSPRLDSRQSLCHIRGEQRLSDHAIRQWRG